MVFNQPIRIERLNDDGGEFWEEYFSCRAYVNALYGSEYWAARAAGCEDTIVFTVRYCRALAAVRASEYRIVFRGEIYDIQSVDCPQFANAYIKLKGVRRSGNHL